LATLRAHAGFFRLNNTQKAALRAPLAYRTYAAPLLVPCNSLNLSMIASWQDNDREDPRKSQFAEKSINQYGKIVIGEDRVNKASRTLIYIFDSLEYLSISSPHDLGYFAHFFHRTVLNISRNNM
jgi:hypothetical protein